MTTSHRTGGLLRRVRTHLVLTAASGLVSGSCSTSTDSSSSSGSDSGLSSTDQSGTAPGGSNAS